MHPLIEKTLRKRGIDSRYLSILSDTGTTGLEHMDEMCERLHELYLSHRHIVLFPDHDMDGIMSGVTGTAGFLELGFHFSLFIPHTGKGYGMKPSDIDEIHALYPDTACIMTCDVGIDCTEAISRAAEYGIMVLVSDHHPGSYHNGAAVTVDPCASDWYKNAFGNSNICGAAVVLNILCTYAARYHGCDFLLNDNIRRLFVFAGIGTVSDAMPLVCENRALVKETIPVLRWLFPSEDATDQFDTFEAYLNTPLSGCVHIGQSSAYRSAFYGLQAILWHFAKKGMSADDVNEDFIGFSLAPMFNSLKRMRGDMQTAFDVFFDTPKASGNLLYLDDLNKERKRAVSDYMFEIVQREQPFAPYAYFTSADGGICGLLATKLMERTGLPTLVFTYDGSDHLFGSGRSPEHYDFEKAAERLSLPLKVSGHPYAFGVSAELDDLPLVFIQLTADIPAEDESTALNTEDALFSDCDFVIGNTARCDSHFDIFDLYQYYKELDSYRPFGKGFFKPRVGIMLTADDMAKFPFFIMGRDSSHVKYMGPDGFSIVMWHGAGDTAFMHNGFYASGHFDRGNYGGISDFYFVIDRLYE